MIHYATLRQVRDYLGIGDTETQDDAKLNTFIAAAVRGIQKYSARRFDVRYETRWYDYPIKARMRLGVYTAADWVAQMNAIANWTENRVRFDDDLLELATLLNGDGTTITSSQYTLHPANNYPKFSLVLKRSSGITWQISTDGDREQIILATAYWGYHEEYGEAWVDTLDTLQSGINAAVTSLSVSDADGDAADLQAYRFQPGNLIKATTADSEVEFMFITGANYTTNTLTVVRGFQGTTAVAHLTGEKLYVFRPMENITFACQRLCAWMYRMKDSDAFDRQAILGSGVMIIPGAMPDDVKQLLPTPRGDGKGLSD